jgi:hypothetical protein
MTKSTPGCSGSFPSQDSNEGGECTVPAAEVESFASAEEEAAEEMDPATEAIPDKTSAEAAEKDIQGSIL